MSKKEEVISLAWCDGGTTDGKFTQGIVYTILDAKQFGINLTQAIRVHGNQIGRQRQVLLDGWYDQTKSDWLLWVDSDVVLTIDILKLLWETADKDTKPVVSGVYFISKQEEGTLIAPLPVIFDDVTEFKIKHIHPLPVNQVIKIDCAGMGLVLMHRSVVKTLRKKFNNKPVFLETSNSMEEFVGEDVTFFRHLKEANIPVYAHTGAIAKHIKRFDLDEKYYELWWNNVKE